MADVDLAGALRRIRRLADLSQRQLATACAVSQSAIAHAENRRRDLPVGVLNRAAALGGLRLALLDEAGREVTGMADGAVRDRVGRRFPAHLDPVHGDERPGRWEDRYSRPRPWFTFDRDRETRDLRRRSSGTPVDHRLPAPDDSPTVRRARRDEQARRLARAAHQRRLAAGEVRPSEDWTCTCPPECEFVTEDQAPRHAGGCRCGCDVG